MSSQPHQQLQGSINYQHQHQHQHNNYNHEQDEQSHLHSHSTQPIITDNDQQKQKQQQQQQQQSIMMTRQINSFEFTQVLGNNNDQRMRRRSFFKQQNQQDKCDDCNKEQQRLEKKEEMANVNDEGIKTTGRQFYHQFKDNNFVIIGKEQQQRFQIQPQTQLKHQHHNIQQPQYHTQTNPKIQHTLQSLTWQLQKIYYRNFFNRLITSYIQSLKQEQKKIRETKQIEIKLLKQANWPFKQLYYKKYRTPNQEIMFEFVNLCAEKIQATFKAYIVNKRHKLALEKVNIFKQRLSAVLKGWKSSNIYNCKKLKQIRKNFTQISLQIDQQIQNPNIDRIKKMKKIQYLQLSQQTLRENFMKCYGYLYDSGAWIFQVERCFKRVSSVGNNKRGGVGNVGRVNLQQQIMHHFPTITKQQQLKPVRRRQRQFKPLNNNNNKDNNNQPNQHQQQQYQTTTTNKTSSTISNHPIQPIISRASQQRPIVAKGKYQFTQEDIRKGNQNQFLTTFDNDNDNGGSKDIKRNKNNIKSKKTNIKKNKHQQPQQQLNQIGGDDNNIKRKEQTNNDYSYSDMNNQPQQHQQDQKPKVNKFKDEQTKRLNKRQKYDPRKAIQQEKRLKLQKQKQRLQKQKQKQKQINQGDDNNVVTQQLQQSSSIATPVIKKNIIKKPIINNKNNLNNKINNRNQPQPKQQRTPRIIQQRERQQQYQQHSVSKQKTVQKIKKENRLNKKGDNNKSIKSIVNNSVNNHKRVQSKVDCWGGQGKYNNRNSDIYNNNEYDKEIDSDNNNNYNNTNNNMSSYKSKYLAGLIKQRMMQSSSTSSIIRKTNHHFNQQYHEQQQQQQYYQQQQQHQQQQAYQSSYLKKLVQQQQQQQQRLPPTNNKGKFSYINNSDNSNSINSNASKLSQIITSIRGTTTKGTTSINSGNDNSYKNNNNYQQNQKQRKSITTNLTNSTHQNKTINTNNNQPVNNNTNNNHRSIQSLQQVYSSQYTDRLNNLKNKLNMLQSARYIQRDQSLPVLLEDTKYVKKMYKQGAFSTLYWPQVRTMETAFLDYVKLTTGF